MTISEAVIAVLDAKVAALLPHLNERQRRLFLAAEAGALGHGGIAAVARLAQVSESTIERDVLNLLATRRCWDGCDVPVAAASQRPSVLLVCGRRCRR